MPFDLESPDFRTHLHRTFAAMRREAPVYRHELPPGQTVFNAGTAWYITRYDDAKAALKDHELFTREFPRAVPPEQLEKMPQLPPIMRSFTENMVNRDEPEHRRLRALVNKAFAPRMVTNLEGRITSYAQQLLDGLQANGTMEAMEDFCFPLTVDVIRALLGLPDSPEDYDLLRQVATIAPPADPSAFEPTARILGRAREYFEAHYAARREQPTDDLISSLVQAEIDGDRLDPEALFSMTMLLAVAGFKTTAYLIGNGIATLLQNPDELAKLKGDWALADSAVEEVLRYEGPMETAIMRWAARDAEWQGQQIRQGDMVFVALAAANRDSDRFDDPNRFDITRKPNPHIAFGSGIHFCLGAHLARLEARIALRTLFTTLPDLELAVSPEALTWRQDPPMRGLDALPLRWSV